MKKTLAMLSLVLLAVLVVAKERSRKIPAVPPREGCIFCHEETTDPDPSHPVEAFGCHTCHLGNAYSNEKERAHVALVKNPGDLRVVGQTCGKPLCHAGVADRVKNSVMATNRGILAALGNHWPGASGVSGKEITDLLGRWEPHGLGEDYFRKMCGGCHLWKPRGDRPGEVGLRGGGCSDCHVSDAPRLRESGAQVVQHGVTLRHPSITTRIPSENCVKCHNRSARIGLSYFGRFESAGYGTPYEGGELSRRRLSGRRFFLELPADVHSRKAGLDCIDCHTATGVMGDGVRHDKMVSQVDITCEACHLPEMKTAGAQADQARRLTALNRKIPPNHGSPVGWTKKGTPVYNLRQEAGKLILYRKRDGKPFEMDPSRMEAPHHGLPGHERVSCQACHSAWMPQCYGCHLAYRLDEFQRDWLTGGQTLGRWKETRSFMRFSKPALGVRSPERIYPVAPCQVFFSCFDEQGAPRPDRRFHVLSLGAFDSHTTSKKSRDCLECHGDPKVLGLGSGILHRKDHRPSLRPTYGSKGSGLNLSVPLDGFTAMGRGNRVAGAPGDPRPFDDAEIRRILDAGACAGCHRRYDDPIYRDFARSKARFEGGEDLPCLR